MYLGERKPHFVTCEQQKRRSDYAAEQSDQRIWCSQFKMCDSLTWYMQIFDNLARLFSLAG